MRLEEAKAKYQGEWIAFRMLEEGDNPEGEVVLHNKDRWTFDKELLEKEIREVYITFAGPLVREGFAIMFPLESSHGILKSKFKPVTSSKFHARG